MHVDDHARAVRHFVLDRLAVTLPRLIRACLVQCHVTADVPKRNEEGRGPLLRARETERAERSCVRHREVATPTGDAGVDRGGLEEMLVLLEELSALEGV